MSTQVPINTCGFNIAHLMPASPFCFLSTANDLYPAIQRTTRHRCIVGKRLALAGSLCSEARCFDTVLHQRRDY